MKVNFTDNRWLRMGFKFHPKTSSSNRSSHLMVISKPTILILKQYNVVAIDIYTQILQINFVTNSVPTYSQHDFRLSPFCFKNGMGGGRWALISANHVTFCSTSPEFLGCRSDNTPYYIPANSKAQKRKQ